MVGVGRDLCGSSSPNPLPKQGHLEQAAQDLFQVDFEYLQVRRIHSLSGQPVPVLHHPQSKDILPRVQLELPVLQFVLVAPCPVISSRIPLRVCVSVCSIQINFSSASRSPSPIAK